MKNSNSGEVIVSLRDEVIKSLNSHVVAMDCSSHIELADTIKSIRNGSIAGKGLESKARKACQLAFFGDDDGDDDYDSLPYVLRNGIAVIPVQGILLNRVNFSGWGITGYEYIQNATESAIANDNVKGIIYDVNSPGGTVYGNFELSAYIQSVNKEKPMIALVNAMACSGGYSIASATGNIVAIPSADIGSIGVYMMHMDVSQAMAEYGIKVSFIYAGDRKVEGNPYEPLSDDAKANMQASVNASYDEFVSLVAANRGMDKQAVIDTQAGVFQAEDALNLGLIDSVDTISNSVSAFVNELSGSTITIGVSSMSNETKQAGSESATAANEARIAERARIKSITTSEEAAGREALAAHLAHETDMTADAAVALLKVSPKQAAAPVEPAAMKAVKTTPFEQAMSNTQNPNVTAVEDDASVVEAPTGAARILAAGRRAGVFPRTKAN